MNIAIQTRSARISRQHGFSLLEVLITLVVIAIALLGTAGLLVNAVKLNKGGQFRTLAVFLATDIAERIEANKIGAVNGNYVVATTGTAPSPSTACAGAPCDAPGLAAYDLANWQNAVAATLPQSTWSIALSAAGNPATYTITISWIDRRTDTTYASAGTGEAVSYTSSRTVHSM